MGKQLFCKQERTEAKAKIECAVPVTAHSEAWGGLPCDAQAPSPSPTSPGPVPREPRLGSGPRGAAPADLGEPHAKAPESQSLGSLAGGM